MNMELGFEGKADVFVPDGMSLQPALGRITHLGVGAHQDDLEFMAYDGILKCYRNARCWFGGVTCTDGAGSSRTGPYAGYTDEAMRAVRICEQRQAAVVGEYGVMLQLGYPSRALRESGVAGLAGDLRRVLSANRMECVYTHNLADKHETHVGVVLAVLEAVRGMPAGARPLRVYGCEVWRDLDWMGDGEKVVLDVSGRPNLAAALNGCFDSQISGGKRYDLGVVGRRSAHATFFQSHESDVATQLTFAMDLTPLVEDERLDVVEYVAGYLDRFKADVLGTLRRRMGRPV